MFIRSHNSISSDGGRALRGTNVQLQEGLHCFSIHRSVNDIIYNIFFFFFAKFIWKAQWSSPPYCLTSTNLACSSAWATYVQFIVVTHCGDITIVRRFVVLFIWILDLFDVVVVVKPMRCTQSKHYAAYNGSHSSFSDIVACRW